MEVVRHLPILTTILSAIFFVVLVRASLVRRSGPHLAWWAFGAFSYGLGTLIESIITLQGNTVELTRLWYIAGALLGGFPLAQGAVFLHLNRRTANLLAWIFSALVVVGSIATWLSPIDMSQFSPLRPTGHILAWKWLRLTITPAINLYSFVFLVGGAIASAIAARKSGADRPRYVGNILISIGGLLPGIGGSLAAKGLVEALYVLELVGLVFIWAGYGVIASQSETRGFPATNTA